MSEKKGHKNEMVLTPSDAADLLRRLADQLEAGGVEIGEVVVENDRPVKIKQSVKTKSDKVSFKLKLKYEAALTPELNGALGALPEEAPEAGEDEAQVEAFPPEPEPDPDAIGTKSPQEKAKPKKAKPGTGKPSFNSVKKSMSKGFKSIKKALAEDIIPSAEELNEFTADCELMTTFSGKGDPKFEDFMHHVGDLKAAAQAGDVKALGRAMAEISAMKKSCHSEFK
jgi:XXXCH domain-containing protein